MHRNERNVQIPLQRMEVSVSPKTIRRDDTGHLLVDVIWTSGATVLRKPWWEDPYIEELSLSSDHVDLSRLNNGAPCLNNHSAYELEDQIGVILRDSASVDGSQGIATIRLSQREEIKGIVQDIEAGIISKISVGYRVNVFEEHVATEEGQIRTLKAIDWTPMELSFVCIPADDGAESRSESKEDPKVLDEKYECKIISQRREEMGKKVTETPVETPEVRTEPTAPVVAPVVETVDKEAIRKEAVASERKRTQEINEAVRAAGFDDSRAEELVGSDISADDARKKIIKEMSERNMKGETKNVNPTIEVGGTNREERKGAAENALLHRLGKGELSKDGEYFAGRSAIKIAEDFLSFEGVDTRNLSNVEIAKRAMMGTSDFPLVLANLANKRMLSESAEAEHNFLDLITYNPVADFKDINLYETGGIGIDKITEKGEIKAQSFTEQADSYKMESYAGLLGFSRQMLVNDDMRVFTKGVKQFMDAIKRLERETFWSIVQAVVFSVGNKNYQTGAGTVLSNTSLSAAKLALRKQKSFDGKKNLNLRGSHLLVPSALEATAEKLIADISASKSDDVNIHSGKYKIVESVELDDVSQLAWYMVAAGTDLVEWAKLIGAEAPRFDTNQMFNMQGMQLKCEYDFAMKAVSHRGFNKSKGAV